MAAPEHEDIEYKRSLGERHEAVITLAAFATARGGVVRFGIGPDGQRVGVMLGRTSLEELANYIRQNTDPPLFPSITVEGEEASAVVTVRVEESPIKPVWAFGRPYKRVGRTNQTLSREETQRLVEATSGRTWDALPCPGLAMDHLLPLALRDYLGRTQADPATAPETVLQSLSLRTDDRLCNAAALLFTERPGRFVPGAQTQCARFDGVTSVRFLDERTLEGPVLEQVEEAAAFVTRNTRRALRITGRPEHEVVPEYPEGAVREAIVNAVCHRDYAAAGTVQVRIYDDRLEVWNPGTLPAGLTVEALYREHPSLPRNRRLADAFHRARLIERWGTGTLRMVEEYRQRDLPPPAFLSEHGIFIVRMQPLPVRAETPTPDLSGLNERQRRAVAYVREHGSIGSQEYQELNGVSERVAQLELRKLAERGMLAKAARGRPIRYVLPG